MSSLPPAQNAFQFIVFDSSVLLQLNATDQLAILRLLRTDFGIQPAIVRAVESEVLHALESASKFRGRQEQFRKALANNTIAIIDRDLLAPLFGPAANGLLNQMETEGARLYAMVDRGEAYSHAASTILGVPIATNDTTAVNRLLRSNETIPRPVLRFWDLIVLGNQAGILDDNGCDRVRQILTKLGERPLPCFANKSFADGIAEFYPRLIDGTRPRIGATEPREKFDERAVLERRPAV